MVMTMLTVAIIPVAFFMVFKSAKDISEVEDEDEEDGPDEEKARTKTANPMLTEQD